MLYDVLPEVHGTLHAPQRTLSPRQCRFRIWYSEFTARGGAKEC